MKKIEVLSSVELVGNRMAITLVVPCEENNAFMRYVSEFGKFRGELKKCLFHSVTRDDLKYLQATGIQAVDKIKVIKKIRECIVHLPDTNEFNGLFVLKMFVEKDGFLRLDERAIQNLKEAGIEVNWVE